MPKGPRFCLVFAPETLAHLEAIERKYDRLIKRAIDDQLAFTPDHPTRNRKPLEEPVPLGASWELRCGPQNRFRIFYEVDTVGHRVRILAIGVKEADRLFIGGEEIEL